MVTALDWVKLSSSSRLSSRPIPDAFQPPYGTPAKCWEVPLTQTNPASKFELVGMRLPLRGQPCVVLAVHTQMAADHVERTSATHRSSSSHPESVRK
jgi:hypothetical protein